MANDDPRRKRSGNNQQQASADATPAGAAELEEALTAKLGEIVPEPRKEEVTQVVHEVVASFQGPLPPPSILQGYDEIVPGRPIESSSWLKRSKGTDTLGNKGL